MDTGAAITAGDGRSPCRLFGAIPIASKHDTSFPFNGTASYYVNCHPTIDMKGNPSRRTAYYKSLHIRSLHFHNLF